MKNFKNLILIIITVLFSGKFIIASEYDVTPFSNIGKNLKDSYKGWNALYQVAAVGLTYVIVNKNYDADMLRTTSKFDKDFSNIFGHAGIYSGLLAPVVVPATMYLTSDDNSDPRTASFAVMQSVCLSVGVGIVLKAITGRKPPEADHPDNNKLSREFRFGFMKGGLHYGWPSGHLMVNTAMMTTISAFYPEKDWIKYLSYGYITFMTTSIISHGEAHWFSDVVAGGLIGYAIGKAVGDNFYQLRKKRNTNGEDSYSARFHPIMSRDFSGVSFSIRF